MFIWTLSC